MDNNINQKIIKIISAEHNNDEPYSVINVSSITEAMQYLKPSTFKLWIYLAKNQNNYTFDLSCVDVCKTCNMSKNTYHTSINELISAGYLVKTSKNNYNFYESIPDESIKVTICK